MSLKFIGKKERMNQFFDKNGKAIACTIVVVEPNVIVQIKKTKKDGYNSLQMGSFDIKEKKVTKPLLGHFKKSNIKPKAHLVESRMEDVEKYEVGKEMDISYFKEGSFVDITGVSKGKGFQGVIKLHNFSGGPASHGSSFHRHAGSTGMRSTPGRCFPGGKRASRMGSDVLTVENLEILMVDKENKLLVIKGAVPGSCGSVIYIKKAKKKVDKSG